MIDRDGDGVLLGLFGLRHADLEHTVLNGLQKNYFGTLVRSPARRHKTLPAVGQDVVIHAVAAVDTTPQRHRFACDVPFQGRRVAGDQQSAAAQAEFTRRNRHLVARPLLPVCCLMGCVGQDGERGIDVRRAGEQGHGDAPISLKYCLTVSWTFMKHFGQ